MGGGSSAGTVMGTAATSAGPDDVSRLSGGGNSQGQTSSIADDGASKRLDDQAQHDHPAAVQEEKEPSMAAFAQTRAQRPLICGSYAPERPYPIYLRGIVEKGFGRGGKELGCPTANLPSKVVGPQSPLTRTGIYFGFARVLAQDPDDPDLVDEGDAEASSSSSSASGSAEMADGQAINFTEEEDFDIDDDGDEVVLGASPVADAFGDQKDWTEGRPLTKPRQMSKSSMKSSRSGATLMERGAGSSTSSTTYPDSGGEDVTLHQPQALANAAAALQDQQQKEKQRTALQEQNKAEQQQQQQQQSKEERRPRNHSSNSSSSSLLRRGKKKPRIPIAPEDTRVFPMVMSVGWNPYYQNTSKTAEVHIMHQFPRDFYGLETRVVVLGYIRPEYNYVSVESLKDDIETDKRVAINSLARPHYQDYGTDPFLLAPSY